MKRALFGVFGAMAALALLWSCESGVKTPGNDQTTVADQDIAGGDTVLVDIDDAEQEDFDRPCTGDETACSGDIYLWCNNGDFSEIDCAEFNKVCDPALGCVTPTQDDTPPTDTDVVVDTDGDTIVIPDDDGEMPEGDDAGPSDEDLFPLDTADDPTVPDDAPIVVEDDAVVPDTDTDIVTDTPVPDVDVDADVDTDAPPPACTLSSTWPNTKPSEWTSYLTLRLSGIINDADDADPDYAFLAAVSARLKGVTHNLSDNNGMFFRDLLDGSTPVVVESSMGGLTWPVSGQLASIWVSQTFVVVDDLLAWKETATAEGLTGVEVEGVYQVAVFEVWIEIIGSSSQATRMECTRGISALNEAEDAYDGAMFFCVDTNTSWAIGETMKMMEYARMLDQDADILAALNEGLDPSDPDYLTDVCTCYEQDGVTPMDCDDMKAEFGL
ncbi:MAG TPA: hypothetical protein PKH10_06355 [bacterium]|nr:hypothetical protein [bacterium]